MLMEVHHHPDVEKKNFKEYLLEGLMIFLAVTMGFFAESLRENMTGKDKEKEYIVSLAHNLRQDSVQLVDMIAENGRKVRGLDSLIAMNDRDLTSAANRKLLYTRAWCASEISAFISNDATMTQLKNSGGLQFIKHEHIADSIAQYDQELRGIYAAEAPYQKYTQDATELLSETLVSTLQKDTAGLKGGNREPFPLLTHDPRQLQIFFNKLTMERGWTQNYIKNLQERVPYNRRLLALLKREYDLE